MTLTDRQREIVELIEEEGASYTDIAAALDEQQAYVRRTIRQLCARYDCQARDLPQRIREGTTVTVLEDQLRLHDDWRSIEIPTKVTKLDWVEHLDGASTEEKASWAVNVVRGSILSLLDGAHVIHRGDVRVSVSPNDFSFPIVGDLDVEWQGRAPLIECKGFLPRVGHKRMKEYGPDQGLDFYQRELYLAAQNRSGRPFYVVWAWQSTTDEGPQLAGKRVDLLPWPADGESLNRLRNVKGAKMAYWSLRHTLDTMSEIAADIASWNGQPYQEALL